MPAIYKDGKWYTGDNSGHMIKDNGTDLYPREALNFTDFNVQDDSVNDETDIKPHRLTQEELSEIMSKKPAPQDGFPILFDERGVERQVGWYVYSDGTKKPVYEKMVQFTTLYAGEHTYAHGISNVEYIWVNSGASWGYDEALSATWIIGGDNSSGNGVKSVWTSSTVATIWLGSHLTDSGRLTGLNVVFNYTKSTDTPQ